MRLRDWQHHEQALPFLKANYFVVRFAIEVFSGTGSFSSAWRRQVGLPIIEFDIRHGEQYDLTLPSVQKLVRGWVSGSLVTAVWMGTPCSSFSRARDRGGGPPRLRSDVQPLGLPGLSPKDDEKVRVGNILMTFSASILRLCSRLIIPCALENPATSRIWLCPALAAACRLSPIRFIKTDFCMYGMPWRKRTKIAAVHVDLEPCSRLCKGRGICSNSHKPHVELSGKFQGVFRTSIAEPYPRALSNALARSFKDALAALEIYGYCDF